VRAIREAANAHGVNYSERCHACREVVRRYRWRAFWNGFASLFTFGRLWPLDLDAIWDEHQRILHDRETREQ
jgi:hypothetical protein